MMIRIYDDIISYSLLLQIEDALTRKETWTFLVDYGSGTGLKQPLSLGRITPRENFRWIQNYLLDILDRNKIDTSSIYRSVNNCYRRLDKPQYHQDPGEISYMFYLNSEWKRHWGAPTKFKSKKYHLSRKVYPKPGRMVAFSSKLWHKGTPSTFLLPDYIAGRFSIVFHQRDVDPDFFD